MTAEGSGPTAVGVTSLTTMGGLVGAHRAVAGQAAPHSAVLLVLFTIPAPWRAWAAGKAWIFGGVVMCGSTLTLARFCFASAERKPATTAPLSLSTMPAGVPAGARIPVQNANTQSGEPLSITVGVSGRSGPAGLPPTASPRTSPRGT